MFKIIKKFSLFIIFCFFSCGAIATSSTRGASGGFKSDYIYFANTIQAVANENARYSIKKFDNFDEFTNQAIYLFTLDEEEQIDYFNNLTPLLNFNFVHYNRYSNRGDFFSITGNTLVHNIVFWFKIKRVWDDTKKNYRFSLDEKSSFLPKNLMFELKNRANEQLQLQIPAIVINGTNETLNKNFVYRDDYTLNFSMLTNYFKVNQDRCYFPEVNIFLPANVSKSISLSITNDIDKKGYYCYPNETKKINIQLEK